VSACSRHRRASFDPACCQADASCARRGPDEPDESEYITLAASTRVSSNGSTDPDICSGFKPSRTLDAGSANQSWCSDPRGVDAPYICIFSSRACAAFAFGFPMTAFLIARSAALVCVVDASIVAESKEPGTKCGRALCWNSPLNYIHYIIHETLQTQWSRFWSPDLIWSPDTHCISQILG
jgi:hypothetical protein